jgi:hypothetical protein
VLLHEHPVEASVAVDPRLHPRLADEHDPLVLDVVADLLGDVVATPGLEESARGVVLPHSEPGPGHAPRLGLAVDAPQVVAAHAHEHEAPVDDPVQEALDPPRALGPARDERSGELEVGQQLAQGADHAPVVAGDVAHPGHDLAHAALELGEAQLLGDTRHELDVNVRLAGLAVPADFRVQEPSLGVALHPHDRVIDEPLLHIEAPQRQTEAVDDEGMVVLEDLDHGVRGTVLGVVNPHPGLPRHPLLGPREGLEGQGGQRALAAGVVGLDAVQEHGGELGEDLAPLRLQTAGGFLDHAIELRGGRGHGAPIVLERRAAWPTRSPSARKPSTSARGGSNPRAEQTSRHGAALSMHEAGDLG